MKRTKVLATIGPSTLGEEPIRSLAAAGADAFRINMSHGDHAQWGGIIEHVRSAAPHAAIVMDTRGPELRIQGLREDAVLGPGDEFLFKTSYNEDIPYLSHPVRVEEGMTVLMDDGAITTTVSTVDGEYVKVRTVDGGVLSDKRKVTLPDAHTNFPILSERDRHDLAFCREAGVDAIALSFTRRAEDVHACRELVGEDTMIVAKIENGEGVDRIEEILDAADGVMVARGDLGVEIALEDVPIVQKRIIELCNRKAKPAIVATQMLESMTAHNRPTRAEASDVANAIIDGADCLMLSDETAVGEYPVAAVETMGRIASRTDPTLDTDLHRVSDERLGVAQAISNAVYDLSLNLEPDAIVSATASGFTARMVARFRPSVPIVGVAHDERTRRQLQLSWGVVPCVFEKSGVAAHKTVYNAVCAAIEHGCLSEDSLVIATAGVDTNVEGSTNLIEVHDVSELLEYHQQH